MPIRLPWRVGLAYVHLWFVTIPPALAVFLTVTRDGRLTDIGSAHGQTIVVSGITLATDALRPEGRAIDATPAAAQTIAGKPLDAGTRVRIDLASGAVTVP